LKQNEDSCVIVVDVVQTTIYLPNHPPIDWEMMTLWPLNIMMLGLDVLHQDDVEIFCWFILLRKFVNQLDLHALIV